MNVKDRTQTFDFCLLTFSLHGSFCLSETDVLRPQEAGAMDPVGGYLLLANGIYCANQVFIRIWLWSSETAWQELQKNLRSTCSSLSPDLAPESPRHLQTSLHLGIVPSKQMVQVKQARGSQGGGVTSQVPPCLFSCSHLRHEEWLEVQSQEMVGCDKTRKHCLRSIT